MFPEKKKHRHRFPSNLPFANIGDAKNLGRVFGTDLVSHRSYPDMYPGQDNRQRKINLNMINAIYYLRWMLDLIISLLPREWITITLNIKQL